ncbi:MbtH family protein [Patulibacter sp.]|uniref:MbtH family protein n=1 Tax=Patulibacter sp. TaxID=1912859 RepID=UPI0027242919|nr:MbtH family protein [Patulibacter sp.]MDO9407838.1 MbtH family protein [Patulibacter sp.]
MTNPFDDPDGTFSVLVNDEGQHSLWPAFADVPDGWTPVLEGATRDDAERWVEEHWTDLRPLSLVRHHGAAAVADAPAGPGSDA